MIEENTVTDKSLPSRDQVNSCNVNNDKNQSSPVCEPVGKPETVCPICAKKIPGTGNLSFHMALHPVDRPQTCDYCVGVFRSKEELFNHVKTVHAKDKGFICDVCGQAFISSWRLCRHAKTHSSAKPYKCAYCDYAFRNYDNWRHHEVQHRGAAPYKCELCQVGFWNEELVLEHKKIGKCTDQILCCGVIYHQRLEYTQHVFEKHHKANLEEHPCQYCHKLFPYASSRKHHESICRKGVGTVRAKTENEALNYDSLVIKRTEDGVYMCSICDVGVKTLTGLKLHHIRQHEPPLDDTMKKYPCSVCEKKYRTLAALYGHKKSHFKKHVCTVCNKSFAHKFLLVNHMYVHEKKQKPFPCEHCEKTFVTKVQLRSHENCHTGFRPYKCRYCDNRFKRRTAVVHHELIHTGEKPYKCKICGVSFTQSSTCKSHEKAHERTDGKRKFHCKDCPAQFWSVTQLKTHNQKEHGDNGMDDDNEDGHGDDGMDDDVEDGSEVIKEKGINTKIQVVTEDGQTHWVEPNDMTTDEHGNVFYYVTST